MSETSNLSEKLEALERHLCSNDFFDDETLCFLGVMLDEVATKTFKHEWHDLESHMKYSFFNVLLQLIQLDNPFIVYVSGEISVHILKYCSNDVAKYLSMIRCRSQQISDKLKMMKVLCKFIHSVIKDIDKQTKIEHVIGIFKALLKHYQLSINNVLSEARNFDEKCALVYTSNLLRLLRHILIYEQKISFDITGFMKQLSVFINHIRPMFSTIVGSIYYWRYYIKHLSNYTNIYVLCKDKESSISEEILKTCLNCKCEISNDLFLKKIKIVEIGFGEDVDNAYNNDQYDGRIIINATSGRLMLICVLKCVYFSFGNKDFIIDDQTDLEKNIQNVLSLLMKFPSKLTLTNQYVSLVHIFSEQDDHLINCFHVILNIYIVSRSDFTNAFERILLQHCSSSDFKHHYQCCVGNTFVSFTSPEHLQALENFPCCHHGNMFFSMENYGKIMGFHDATTYHICLKQLLVEFTYIFRAFYHLLISWVLSTHSDAFRVAILDPHILFCELLVSVNWDESLLLEWLLSEDFKFTMLFKDYLQFALADFEKFRNSSLNGSSFTKSFCEDNERKEEKVTPTVGTHIKNTSNILDTDVDRTPLKYDAIYSTLNYNGLVKDDLMNKTEKPEVDLKLSTSSDQLLFDKVMSTLIRLNLKVKRLIDKKLVQVKYKEIVNLLDEIENANERLIN